MQDICNLSNVHLKRASCHLRTSNLVILETHVETDGSMSVLIIFARRK